MAEHLLQGGEVFEITDHTTASDWERFVASLEEILTEWKLDKQSSNLGSHRELGPGAISSGIWFEKHDSLRFGNVAFDLRYQYLDDSSASNRSKNVADADEKVEFSENTGSNSDDDEEFQDAEAELWTPNQVEDTVDSDQLIPTEVEKEHGEFELPENIPECLVDLNGTANDFASKAHCLVRWYNLRRFLILSPRADTIVSVDKIKLLLSSASLTMANIDCHVPLFVQILNPKNYFFQGVSEHSNIRTTYDMIMYNRKLKQYCHLSELINMFRERAGCNLSDPITATIRLNYCLSMFDLFDKPEDRISRAEHPDDELIKMTTSRDSTNVRKPSQDMRSGARFEDVVEAMKDCVPHHQQIIRFIHLAALWPPISDKVISDTQVHSDLDPAEAPIWKIRCVTKDNCNMKLVHETQALYNLFESAIDYAYDNLDADVAFDCDKEAIKSRFLRLSYDLATQPEVVLSEEPTDSGRKLIALLYYQAAELSAECDALDQLASQLKKKPSLSEIYRSLNRSQRPSVKEFIIRTQVSRPFNSIATPALPQRMFCTISDNDFRLCGAFSELCN